MLAVGDVDADGTEDVDVTTENQEEARVFFGSHSGPRPGDVNADGRIDVSDVVTILLFLFADRALPCSNTVDFNGDGDLNLADALLLLTYLLRAGDPPTGGLEPCP